MFEKKVLSCFRPPEHGDGWSPIYEAHDAHGLAGSAVRTGRYGADDYPWNWGITPLHDRPAGVHVSTSGVADTLRSAKDQAEQAARLTR